MKQLLDTCRVLFVGGILCLPHLLSAAVFELTNGDRVSGEFLDREGTMIRLRTDLLGEIQLPVDVFISPPGASGETAAPVVPVAPDPVVEPGVESPTEPTGFRSRRLNPYYAWEEFWEDNVIFRFLRRFYPLMGWKNQINFGLFLESSDTDEHKLDFGFKAERRVGAHQVRLEARHEYTGTSATRNGEKIDRTTRNRFRSSARYRYDYVKAFFIQSDTRYQQDMVKEIYHDAEELFGLGYRWIDDERLQISITPSFGVGYRKINSDAGSFEWLASFQQDLEFNLTDRMKITEEASVSYAPTMEGDFLFNFQAGIENQLNRLLSMVIRYDFTLDDRVPLNVEKTSQGITLSFAAKF